MTGIKATTIEGTLTLSFDKLPDGKIRQTATFTDPSGNLVPARCSIKVVKSFADLLIGAPKS